MENKIQSQKEFSIGEKTFVINLYEAPNYKHCVEIFEKIESKGVKKAKLLKNGAVIKTLPFTYLSSSRN